MGNSTTDAQDATAINYRLDEIDIYSNSWGPSDFGFFVARPGIFMTEAFKNGARSVSELHHFYLCIVN